MEKRKALSTIKKKKIHVKYFMFAFKIKVIKIIKKQKQRHLKQPYKMMHSLQSKKYDSQWFNNYKNLQYSHKLFRVEQEICSGITSLPTPESGASHYLNMLKSR